MREKCSFLEQFVELLCFIYKFFFIQSGEVERGRLIDELQFRSLDPEEHVSQVDQEDCQLFVWLMASHKYIAERLSVDLPGLVGEHLVKLGSVIGVLLLPQHLLSFS
jgi:hypothetical protein